MIIDLPRFIASEHETWAELEKILERLEADAVRKVSLAEAQRLHFLYQKASADLAKINTFAAEPETRRFLEALVARAYAEIHESRDRSGFKPWQWFARDFPRVFRKHLALFWLSLAITLAGTGFGAAAVHFDYDDAKSALIPAQFGHLNGSPQERVQEEESGKKDRFAHDHASFSGQLMANNIRVSILTLALGMSWGLGSMVMLFYNGVILGVVACDYIQSGETLFLCGWLLPHGVIEIPAILIAGQAGLLLGRTLLGSRDRTPLRERLRNISSDLALLIFGVAGLLVWAGIIESFLSQYHQPVIPYVAKIAFGLVELAGLIWFLNHGKRTENQDA
jgi:uncharacterized membrane protein SpoIIM required for sporulation